MNTFIVENVRLTVMEICYSTPAPLSKQYLTNWKGSEMSEKKCGDCDATYHHWSWCPSKDIPLYVYPLRDTGEVGELIAQALATQHAKYVEAIEKHCQDMGHWIAMGSKFCQVHQNIIEAVRK
jgi:hypothetical protein